MNAPDPRLRFHVVLNVSHVLMFASDSYEEAAAELTTRYSTCYMLDTLPFRNRAELNRLRGSVSPATTG